MLVKYTVEFQLHKIYSLKMNYIGLNTKKQNISVILTNQAIKKAPFLELLKFYACPAGPKLSGIGACSVSLISP